MFQKHNSELLGAAARASVTTHQCSIVPAPQDSEDEPLQCLRLLTKEGTAAKHTVFQVIN
jgi:hypothetical protein